jgi:glutamyl-tRNA reductase
MPLAVVGLSHQTAPVEVRERFALPRGEVRSLLGDLVDSRAIAEAALLSTCNRTECYLVPAETDAVDQAAEALIERAGIDSEDASRYLYVHRDRHAVRHLLRVAAGLDSMILGEPQIQGQVREAYERSREVEARLGSAVGPQLNRLFQTALRVGGRVRSETTLGIGAASVPSAAVELAKKIFGSLRGRRALVLGAGEMSEVTLDCLEAEGVRAAVVANRTFERATELAERRGASAVRLDDLPRVIGEVDIVVASTSAPHPVLTRERIRSALVRGLPHPLCILDIAIPRDVEPALEEEPNVFLYNLDDLHQMVDENLDRRRSEIGPAEALVDEGVEEFWAWYTSLSVVPTIRELRAQTEEVRQAETERILRRLQHLAPEDQEAIDLFARSLMNKVLHAPTVRLKEAVGNGRGTSVVDTLRYLFELDSTASRDD